MEIDTTSGRPILDDYDQARRDKYVAGLYALADFYERRPNLPAPHCWTETFLCPDSKENLAALVREAGTLKKLGRIEDDTFELRREFSDNVFFRIVVDKKRTCERIKVGEKTIPAQPETIVPAKPQQVVEVFEWKCSPILANTAAPPVEQEAR